MRNVLKVCIASLFSLFFLFSVSAVAQDGGDTVWRAQTGVGVNSDFASPGEACEANIEFIKTDNPSAWGNVEYSGLHVGPTSTSLRANSYLCQVTGPSSGGDVTDYNLGITVVACFTGSNVVAYQSGYCEVPLDSCDGSSVFVGNPIEIGGGTKIEQATDWVSPLDPRLEISRTFRSDSNFEGLYIARPFSGIWSLSLLQQIDSLHRRQGGYAFDTQVHHGSNGFSKAYTKTYGAAGFNPIYKNSQVRLTWGVSVRYRAIVEPSGKRTDFEPISSRGDFRPYSTSWPDGYLQTFSYDVDGRLEEVADNKGQVIKAEWQQMVRRRRI